jgi:hypothetical protein
MENPKGRHCLGDLGVDGRIMLKCILKKWVMSKWTVLIWLRIKSNDKLYEYDSEIWPINGRKFLQYLGES